MSYPEYASLPAAFESIFRGQLYRHRDQTRGNFVASHLYEDLVSLGKSPALSARVATQDRVLNRDAPVVGRKARRGDATFGELVPGTPFDTVEGCLVARGPVATVEIGVEAKTLAKAMVKQIDRVVNDLRGQAAHFRASGGDPICIAIIAVNHADSYVSYEGDREYPTEGKSGRPHPIQEAQKATDRLLSDAASEFDEFQILAFRATNAPPYPFEWVDLDTTLREYAALLTRVTREYDAKFP